MYNMLKYFNKSLFSNRWAIDSLAKISVLLSPLMRPGIFFFHQGRCGSQVVASLLSQHPKISSYQEIFQPYMQKKSLPTKPENMLRMRRVYSIPSYAVVEAKFFECQHLSLLDLSIRDFVDVVRRCGFRKFIILNRLNYLRKIVSTRIAIARGGKWHYKANDEVPTTTVRLDVEKTFIMGKAAPIVDLFKYFDEQYQILRVALAGEDVLELTYEEDIFDDPMIAYNKVCNWLGLERFPARVIYRRTNVKELSEVVENWGEVSGVLSDTQYAWMVK